MGIFISLLATIPVQKENTSFPNVTETLKSDINWGYEIDKREIPLQNPIKHNLHPIVMFFCDFVHAVSKPHTTFGGHQDNNHCLRNWIIRSIFAS